MIEMRRKQLSFGDGLIAEEVSDLREKWMTHADEVRADEEIVAIKFRLLEIGRVARQGAINRDKLKQRYGQLLNATSRVERVENPRALLKHAGLGIGIGGVPSRQRILPVDRQVAVAWGEAWERD